MRETKSINQVLSISAIKILNELLSKCDVSIDSIKLCSNRMFVIDSVLLKMFGYIEKKFQDYYLYYAMLDPNQRSYNYIKNHNIEFEFKEVLKIYKMSFKIDNNDNSATDRLITDLIRPNLNCFKEEIKKAMCNFSIWEDIKYLYDNFNSFVFTDNNDKMYKDLCELFGIAYDYRNNLAHNLDFEYKNYSYDFDVLKGKTINFNLFSYFFIIIIIDYIINKCYVEVLNSNLLLF